MRKLFCKHFLTGESVPVRKSAGDAAVKVLEENKIENQKTMLARVSGGTPIPGGEELPHVFAGTLVVRGTGQARVFATGIRSEMGKIGHALQDECMLMMAADPYAGKENARLNSATGKCSVKWRWRATLL